MNIDNSNLEDRFYFLERMKIFDSYVTILVQRYDKFSKLSLNETVDWFTYFDMIIVQLRALCVENARYSSNHTLQITLRKLGKDDLADRIDTFLETTLIWDETPLKEAIKFIADKFICHYDDVDLGERALEHSLRGALSNPEGRCGLSVVIKEIVNVINEAYKDSKKC